MGLCPDLEQVTSKSSWGKNGKRARSVNNRGISCTTRTQTFSDTRKNVLEFANADGGDVMNQNGECFVMLTIVATGVPVT